MRRRRVAVLIPSAVMAPACPGSTDDGREGEQDGTVVPAAVSNV